MAQQRIIYLSVEDAEQIAQLLASRLDSEPIPPFTKETRYRLDSCLQQIQQPYYGDLVNQAANVFYLINKNHPLTNGNKRMSVAVLYIFLAFNRKLVRIGQPTMVKLARWVVQTQASHKAVVVDGLEIMIKEALVDIPPEDYRRLMGRG